MKKAKKIVIGVIGGITAAGIGLLGKYYYDSASGQVLYGAVDMIPQNYIQMRNSAIEEYLGQVQGSKVKELVRRISRYNQNGVFPNPVKVEIDGIELESSGDGYITPSISKSSLFDVSTEYDEDGNVSKVNVTSIIEDTNSEEINSQIERSGVNENN